MTLPPIDPFSFALGFVFAVLILLIISRIRKLSPQIKKSQETRKQKTQINDIGECERLYRKSTLRKCQRSHMASALFALNEIYVDLGLVGHQFYDDPEYLTENEPLLFQQFPIFLGNPTEFADLPAPLLTLEQALSGGRNIMVANEIGSGKTTLLAQFASNILEGKCHTDIFNQSLPVFININDLDYLKGSSEKLWIEIADQLHEIDNKIDPEILKIVLENFLSNKKLILLLDGLDEIFPAQFQYAVAFISSIIQQYPNAKIVTAIGPHYSANLPKLGFAELSLHPPTSSQRNDLYLKWNRAWEQLNIHGLTDTTANRLTSLWVWQSMGTKTMVEFTHEIWSNLAVDHQPGEKSCIFDSINRETAGLVSMESLQTITDQISKNDRLRISRTDLINILEKDKVVQGLLHQSSGQLEKEDASLSITEFLNLFQDTNIICTRSNDSYAFSNPSIFCFLLSRSSMYVKKTSWKDLIISPVDLSILNYSVEENKYLANWIADEDPYLYRNLILAFQQIENNKQNIKYFPLLAKKVFPILLDESLPATMQYRLLPVFGLDTQSQVKILEHLTRQPSPTIKQLAALGYASIKGSKSIEALLAMLSDPDLTVEMSVSLSLFIKFDQDCVEILEDILLNGRDALRGFVAQLMAFKPVQGYAILKEMAENGSSQSKKAAIAGLRLIDEKWANELLEKISTSDEQWFIRDAAAHALETKWNISHYVPSKRSNPSETSWLIKYASQEGQSIPAGEYPYELFYRLIDAGNYEEKMTALAYLMDKPDEYVPETLIHLMKNNNPLREEAFNAYSQLYKQTR